MANQAQLGTKANPVHGVKLPTLPPGKQWASVGKWVDMKEAALVECHWLPLRRYCVLPLIGPDPWSFGHSSPDGSDQL